jgi:hypothetical protein
MTDGEMTIVAGIEIPSTNPVFLTVVGIHVLLGLACTITGVVAMLSRKRAGGHPRYGTIYFGAWVESSLPPPAWPRCAGLTTTTCSSWEHCRLQRPMLAVGPGSNVGAIGSGCTSLEWDRLTFCS